MADRQEQFSYEDYKTHKRVAKILAENGGEPENNGPSESGKNDSESDDPSIAYRERRRKEYEAAELKRASVTDAQMKEANGVLDGIRW